ncbi:MAG: alpha/beta hydrolase [Candidatus Bathyarchaeota archaeon]|nr:alpha/beta hydrolase [Candidatus Bathyarchaeota archaeon]
MHVGISDLVAGVKEIQQHFKMTDGFDLFCRHWKAVGARKKSVICIHGIGGHSGFFRVLGQDLAKDGLEVYALDLRGFGNSKEETLPRGDTSDFNRHLQDVDEIVDFVRKRHLENKVYMFGWSLGVLYTLWYSANHPDSLDGMILAAPYWVGFMPRIYSSKIPSMLRSAPKTTYDSYKNWSRDFKESEEGKILLQDPLFTTKRSWRWLGGVKRNLSDKVLQNASQTKKPTLIILGEKDDIDIRTGAKQILESLATKDKSIQTFLDADHFFYHAIFLKTTAKHNPAKRKQVTSVVKDWLSTH